MKIPHGYYYYYYYCCYQGGRCNASLTCAIPECFRDEFLMINNTQNNNRFTPFVRDNPGELLPATHPPTILIIIQSLLASSIYHDPYRPPCSNYMLGNLFAQPLSMSSLVSW